VLTADPPVWNLSGVTTTYQWKRGTTTLTGQTGTLYTVTASDVGKDLTVVATGTKDGYKAGTSTSNVIVGATGSSPVPTVDPSISGTPKYGQTLKADHGTWSGTVKSYAYQWLRNGDPISGATGSSYRVAAADATTKIAVRVTVTETGLDPGVATSGAVTIDKLSSTTSAGLVAGTIAKGKHGKVNVVVSGSGVVKPTGKLTVKQGKKTITSVSLKAKNAGRKTITLPVLGKGKHKLKVVYSGSDTVKKSTSSSFVLHVG
jgi:hypothetical protein